MDLVVNQEPIQRFLTIIGRKLKKAAIGASPIAASGLLVEIILTEHDGN